MEQNHLIVRSRGIVDSRQTLVTLTKKGRHLESCAKDIPDRFIKCWQGKHPNTKSAASFTAALDSMIETLKAH